MEQKTTSENSGRAPGQAQAQRHKYGRKIAPVTRDVNNAYQDTSGDARGNHDDSRSVKSVSYDASSDVMHTYDAVGKVAPPSHHGSRLHLLPNLLKVPNIRVINRTRPREEEITKCQTKCFFFLLGVALMAFGVGLTYYGVDADLRDFLILGPSFLIIGFILIVIGAVLICKDVYILNQSAFSKSASPDDEENYYNIQPVDAQEVAQANERRMNLYTVPSSRPQTVTSQRSDGALTTSDLLMEQRPGVNRQDTPEPMVPTRDSVEMPTKPVRHPNSAPNSPSKTAQGGSTITVRSSEEGDTWDNTVTVQTTGDSTHSVNTHTVQMRAGDSPDGDTAGSPETAPDEKATYCSPVHSAQRMQTEIITTEL